VAVVAGIVDVIRRRLDFGSVSALDRFDEFLGGFDHFLGVLDPFRLALAALGLFRGKV